MNATLNQDVIRKKYVRYTEGAKQYSMCKNTFVKIATEAKAVRKIGRVSLVNVDILEKYLESFGA